MKTIKRSLSVLLVLLMLVSTMQFAVNAEEQDNRADSISNINTSLDSETFQDPVPEYLLDEREEDCRNWLQYDERWSSIPLGTSAYTIGSSGCTMVSLCKLMIQNQLATAKQLNPKILGRWMNNHGGFDGDGLIQWEAVEDFCEKVLGKKFTIDTAKTSYPSSDVNAYEFAGTGEHKIYDTSSYLFKNDDEGRDRYNAHIARMKALMQAGYHLVINVHDGSHWIGVDEIKTKANNYDHIYIVNSWTSDGTFTRGTLEDYLAIDAVRGNGSHYSSINRFQRIAAFKTTDDNGAAYSQNAFGYSDSDNYKKWSRYDSRWSTTVLDEPNSNKADYIGDWGQALLALNKELIQAGVKTDAYTPNDLKSDLTSKSIIGSTDGVITWNNIKNFDEKITESGVAYSSSIVSSKSEEMLKKMKEEGYHYIVQIKSKDSIPETDEDMWVAIDEEKSLAEGKLYKLSSGLIPNDNINDELTGSFVSVKYFKTSPSYVPVHFSGVNAEVTAKADGTTIEDGEYVKLGSTITLKAVPTEDYKIGTWTVNNTVNSETSDTLSFELSEETTVVHTAKALTVVYLDATGSEGEGGKFTKGNEIWYVYTYNTGEDGIWIQSTGKTDDGYLKFSGLRDKLNFVRLDKSKENESDFPDFKFKWNQTDDLDTQNNKVYRLTSWNGGYGDNYSGTWEDMTNNTVYLYPNAVSTNNRYTPDDNDVFTYAWTWNTSTDGHWIEGTIQENGLIKFENVQTHIQFNRMNGDQSLPPTGNPGKGEYILHQTADIVVNTSNADLYVLDGYENDKIKYYNNSFASSVTENDYRYWTKTDPRWNDVRLGGSTTVGDYTGNWYLAQAIAKLAIQAGVRDSSTWSIADYAADCYGSNGYMKSAADIAKYSGLTDYRFEQNKSLTGSDIYQLILNGYHIVLRIGTEDVAVDEKKTIENNQIWVWRCTQIGESNSARLIDIKNSDTYERVFYFKGGTTPGLTRDFDYRRWSRYDGRWKNNAVGTTGEHIKMFNNGALIMALAKMIVQAGLENPYDTTVQTPFTPEVLRAWLESNNYIESDGALQWGGAADYTGGKISFGNAESKNCVIYLKFDNEINGKSGYPRQTTSYNGTVYKTADEVDTIMEAIRQGYHMLIEVKLQNSTTQSWVAIDEKASLEKGKVIIMDSEKAISSNADPDLLNDSDVTLDSAYDGFYRIVGYKGATTPIAESVTDSSGNTVSAVNLVADPSDPAYVNTVDNTPYYVKNTTGDVLLKLSSASTAQNYKYCIADTEEAAREFASSTTVTPADSNFNYTDGTVTISIPNVLNTASDGQKYIAVKAVNGSAESNVVTASISYKTVQLLTGFAPDSTTNPYSVTVDRGESYTMGTEYTLEDGMRFASETTVEPSPALRVNDEGVLTSLTITPETAGKHTVKMTSATVDLSRNGKNKTAGAAIDANDTFVINVNEVYVDVTYYQNFNSEDTTVTSVEKVVKGSTVVSIPSAPEHSGYTFNGWYTARSGGEQALPAATYSTDTALYAQWTYTGFAINFYETDQSVTPCYTITVGLGEKIPEIEFYNATPDRGNGYVFKGWYYNDGSVVDKNTTYTADANLYAHWATVTDVDKDNNDNNIISGKYSGYGLKGVQIRKENLTDGNNLDENNQPKKMPGGLRFITSLSQSLLDEIDEIDGSVDRTNIEYGYAVTKKEMLDGYLEHYFPSQEDRAGYKIKNCDTNVNGVNTTGTVKPRTADNDYRYVTNVNCTSLDYDENAAEANRKYDHKKYGNYRLYTMVITYEDESAGDKSVDIVARPYLKYTDANGLLRYRYDDYTGTNVNGGCSVSYNGVMEYAGKVDRQESE